MSEAVNLELQSTTTSCDACSPLPPEHPDRMGCVCRSPVGLPYAALVLEPAPLEPTARLDHLRRQASIAAGARDYAEREATYQDRWDRKHARDLRATSELYGRAERRLRREIERVERELRATAAAAPPPTTRTMSSGRARARRTPGRARRPAVRRAAAQQRHAVDDGGGGDPPPGDPDPDSLGSPPIRSDLPTTRSTPASVRGVVLAEASFAAPLPDGDRATAAARGATRSSLAAWVWLARRPHRCAAVTTSTPRLSPPAVPLRVVCATASASGLPKENPWQIA